MSVAQVHQVFGAPESEEIDAREKSLIYRGQFYMVFEFELPTGRLLTWSVF